MSSTPSSTSVAAAPGGPATPSGPTVTRSVELDVGVEAAWRLVGTAPGLAAWLGRQVEAELEPGGAVHVVDDEGADRRGTITAVHPGRSLSFEWAAGDGTESSTVAITLDEAGEGRTRVTVVETLATAGGRAVACADAGAAWEGRLLGLELGALVGPPELALAPVL